MLRHVDIEKFRTFLKRKWQRATSGCTPLRPNHLGAVQAAEWGLPPQAETQAGGPPSHIWRHQCVAHKGQDLALESGLFEPERGPMEVDGEEFHKVKEAYLRTGSSSIRARTLSTRDFWRRGPSSSTSSSWSTRRNPPQVLHALIWRGSWGLALHPPTHSPKKNCHSGGARIREAKMVMIHAMLGYHKGEVRAYGGQWTVAPGPLVVPDWASKKVDIQATCALERHTHPHKMQTRWGDLVEYTEQEITGHIAQKGPAIDKVVDFFWALPMGSLKPMAGITSSRWGLDSTDDACMIYNGDKWFLTNRTRNKQMHALYGNCLFAYLLLVFMLSLSCDEFTAFAPFDFWRKSWVWFVILSLCIASRVVVMLVQKALVWCNVNQICQTSRFVCKWGVSKHRRRCWGRVHRKTLGFILALCFTTMVLQIDDCTHFTSGSSRIHFREQLLFAHEWCCCQKRKSPLRYASVNWFVPRRMRNKIQHSNHGNTMNSTPNRTRWESTPECPGLAVANSDELSLPGDALLRVVWAHQVSNNAEGIALVNSTFLLPKLQVKGGTYLCLILPGKIGRDLEQMLQSVSPTLRAWCY